MMTIILNRIVVILSSSFISHVRRDMRIIPLIIVILLTLFSEVAMKIPNPYKVLGIPKDANEDQIR